MVETTIVQSRAKAALRSLFIADALAMPAHWFYNPLDIDQTFNGGIQDFESPPVHHPSSIMSLHSTSGGGRRDGSRDGAKSIVGEVILRGKREFWDRPNIHYHQGMAAGDNTLNAYCALALMRSMNTGNGHYDQGRFLDKYLELMMSELPSHPDTYAESFHRGFFAKYEQGLPPDQCAMVTHDTPSIGGLVMIAPIVVGERLRGTALEAVQDICRAHLYLTHPDEFLAEVCAEYVKLVDYLLFSEVGSSPIEALLAASRGLTRRELHRLVVSGRDDREVIGRLLSPACYITDAWPAVLYLACRYHGNSLKALLINTNAGGDNVHRGAVLGVLTGLINGFEPAGLFERLTGHEAINREIERLTLSGAPTT